ncbi:D-ribose pyranase [Vibrio sp. V27_P1S3P104]|uniref:D-ribose pyranase n=1 Tax=unclassified Vibrio TaxID=2614977 RepID=UPI001372A8C1|nr:MULTISPECIES: D-ribose pyranase [unclassified Vibrio]NAW68280.1 D-ribose pyranase [Vibrio sp. V28_P6S34P95]NAX05855.1 D-ribose pyranase [Vibrio sp. V30_P3S12P165]NAX33393.1 D-ribose pyranase [Vibrio sp. V29_P1S30P107]NAX36520.1 D-ribose pyranase [Vibrio sp. V27_P1S3P104]NAX39479.1 D-ribose pyranase [Vibrio sp. V26_P1S5P106]
MKKSTLLNAELSYLVATLGHTDEVTICDAGLPIDGSVQRIDLALTHGIPSFIETVKVILSEMQVQAVVLAQEFAQVSPDLYAALMSELKEEETRCGHTITMTYLPHEAFKIRTGDSRAVIRTGECTPYANIIFQAGVVF